MPLSATLTSRWSVLAKEIGMLSYKHVHFLVEQRELWKPSGGTWLRTYLLCMQYTRKHRKRLISKILYPNIQKNESTWKDNDTPTWLDKWGRSFLDRSGWYCVKWYVHSCHAIIMFRSAAELCLHVCSRWSVSEQEIGMLFCKRVHSLVDQSCPWLASGSTWAGIVRDVLAVCVILCACVQRHSVQ